MYNGLIKYVNRTKEWCINGELHRVGGSAVEYPDGSNVWHLNGAKKWYLNDVEYTDTEHQFWSKLCGMG